MSTYLLDTHVFLWLLADPDRVPEEVRSTLDDPRHDLAVSAASAMEIATKTRLGKLDGQPVLSSWRHAVAGIGARELPVTGEHGVLAGSLRWEHRDPFDRLLVAQAQLEPATLVTRDAAVVAYERVAVLRA
ncbi:type II toxin-antitoxin system VapC family toxin [Cellulomonas triticagri]|uniref:Type II toxin-antitoxin system VapC family toxin n=1 Tax=Cellulomonas triticagri TaxID=2483352 RepID=A0A3M2J618_9CELL|nr:type II toxin-antitoxin system VapC family toxin [Cellulomonas triticagri]RMI09552.1 type II toxin-antitoxin system VapC family toxin [Cellulomonas triticagri]